MCFHGHHWRRDMLYALVNLAWWNTTNRSCVYTHSSISTQYMERTNPHRNTLARLNEGLSNCSHEWRARSDWNTDDANNSFVSRECEGNLRQNYMYIMPYLVSHCMYDEIFQPVFLWKKAGEEPGSKAMGVCLCIAASKDVPQCNKIPQHHCILWGLADPLHLRNISSCFCSKLK